MEQIRLPTGEKLYQDQLANGLTVFILPKSQFLRTYAVLSTNYGSIDSQFKIANRGLVEVPPGIAHFLEHKLFEEEDGNAFDRFAQWGASVNAFTSHTQTSYLFSTIEGWQEALIELISFVNSPYLTEENVEKEKGIIEQELRMYEDHPDHRIHSMLLENLYHANPVRIDIGGTVESVWAITVQELLDCYHTFYQPSNMALAVVGDVDPGETLSLIRQNYPTWEHGQGSIERFYPQEPVSVVHPWVEETLNISRPRYLLGFKHEPKWQGEELLRQQIIMSLVWRLVAGRSTQFFEDLYTSNLVNDSFGASFSSSPQFAYSIIGSETEKPERLHEELSKIIKKLQTEPLSTTDIERLKRRIYGGHLASYDSFEYVANRFISHHFSQTPYHKFLELVRDIKVEEVQTALNAELDWDRSTVAVLRPVQRS